MSRHAARFSLLLRYNRSSIENQPDFNRVSLSRGPWVTLSQPVSSRAPERPEAAWCRPRQVAGRCRRGSFHSILYACRYRAWRERTGGSDASSHDLQKGQSRRQSQVLVVEAAFHL